MNGAAAVSEMHLLNEIEIRILAHATAGYTAKNVGVDIDERAPSTAPDVFIVVIPAGIEAGPRHAGGGAEDLIYSVDVLIALRATKFARDRERNMLTALTKSFYLHQKNINAQIDFVNAMMGSINIQMITDSEATGVCDTFIEPLRFLSAGRIREAPAEIFAGVRGESAAALVRTLHYGGARREVKR